MNMNMNMNGSLLTMEDAASAPHGQLHHQDDFIHHPDDELGPHHHGHEFPPEGIFIGALTQDSLVCSIIMSVITVVGLVSNSLMLRAWMKYPHLRNDFYTVFAALSLIDILFLVISLVANISDMMELHEVNTVTWCKYSRYLMCVCGFIAGYLIAALAALRAILLTNRNVIPRPRAKHLMCISGFSYVLIFLISIPIVSMYTSDQGFCYFDPWVDDVKQTWLLNSFATFVPLFLVFLFYVISYVLGKRYFADSYSPRERQKSRLVTSVVIAFVVCQVPYRVASIYELYISLDDEEEFLRILIAKDYLMCVLMAGKVLRPILCSKMATDLGHSFDEIINCQSCHKPSNRPYRSPVRSPPLQPELLPGGSTPIPTHTIESDLEVDPEPPSPLGATPSRSRVGVDRTISTSSTASTNSQAPLIRHSSSSSPSELEMM